jgi:lipopolysaccharide transport system ATP-binding protein
MPVPAIRVENLGKRYALKRGSGAAYRTLRDEIVHAAGAPLRWLRGEWSSSAEEFWALRDVNFEVQPGEVVGVIGRNGAGKSTLLKILSRITRPTTGRVALRGRVGSLLEVGTGFHPELTGRENILLSGAVLGMKRAEILRRFDEIVAFAEVEKFLDTPVKRYSSGMYVRLAFAVAAHLEPDILIVDEVLAVGDAKFQKKCLGRLSEIAADGRTVLLVSHNMTAVKSMCRSAVHLEAGCVAHVGQAGNVVAAYLHEGSPYTTERTWLVDESLKTQGAQLLRVAVRSLDDESEEITCATPFEIAVDFASARVQCLNVSVVVYNEDNVAVFNTTSAMADAEEGVHRSACVVPGNLFNEGQYRLRVLLVRNGAEPLLDVYDTVGFQVVDESRAEGWMDRFIGVVRPKLTWRTTQLSNHHPDLAHEHGYCAARA